MNTCTGCGVVFEADESPDDDRCVVCLDRWDWVALGAPSGLDEGES